MKGERLTNTGNRWSIHSGSFTAASPTSSAGGGRDRRAGFTLIELLVTVVILSIVTASVYQLYLTQYRHTISQDLRSEMLQRARVAMNDMTREMRMAGFSPQVDAVNTADTPQFTFEQLNNRLPAQPIGFTKDRRITYRFDAGNKQIMKRVQLWNTALGGADKYTANAEDVFLENITNLTFNYYGQYGQHLPAPVAAADLKDIRRVDVSLTAETSEIDPITKDRRTTTLTFQIYPRNLGIEESTLDQTCPPAPTGLVSVDPNACGELDLSWNANTDVDLGGYRMLYGLVPGLYSGVQTVGTVTSATLEGLTAGTLYYLALSAFDTSSNECGTSIEITGTGPGNPDTLPDPGIPQQTLSLDATATTSTVALTWQKNSDSYPSSRPDSDVNVAYDVYRSDDAGSTYTKIATENSNTYEDTPPLSSGCKVLWYKVEPANCLDQVGPVSTEVHGDAAGLPGGSNEADVPQNGVTRTFVTDGLPPAIPANFASASGYKRNYLIWDNPPDLDFSHTVVRYSKAGFPANPTDGLPVENAPGGNGRFNGSPGQTMTFTHDGGTVPPSLLINTTYYYTIFSYNFCGNVSTAQAIAQTASAQCGDEPAGPSSGIPPAPTLPNPSSVDSCQSSQAKVRWELTDDSFPGGVFDLAGYNVYRADAFGGPYIKQNGSILFGTYPGIRTYTDATLVDGNAYYYKITMTDCDWEENGGLNGGGEGPFSPVIKVAPGGLIQSTDNPQVLSQGDHHQVVIFWVKNTKENPPADVALGQITLQNLTLTYANPNARVMQVRILNDLEDSSDDETLYSDASAPLDAGSGSVIPLSGSTILNGQEDVPIEVLFELANKGTDDSLDMRDLDITAAWDYENVATPLDPCDAAVTFHVPASPLVKATTQDNPFVPTIANTTPGINVASVSAPVNVFADVADPDGQGIDDVDLFWQRSDLLVLAAPDTGSWTKIEMVSLGGGVYAADDDPLLDGDTRIPIQAGSRVWYYIVVTDKLDNYDRNPAEGLGAFTYDHVGP